MKRFAALFCAIILILSLAGCFRDEQTPPKGAPEQATITVTPVDLFTGEGKKFKLFLGSLSGAVKLRYDGAKPSAKLDIDIWEHGNKVSSQGSVGDLFFSSEEDGRNEVELIFSIERFSADDQQQHEFAKIKVGTIHDSGSSMATFSIPWDSRLKGYSTIAHHDTVSSQPNEPIHVWGIQATSGNVLYTSDFSQESLNRLEWTILFTLRYE